jgi:predicted ATP-grasp superfamily ATP-dependent carboligase
VADVPPDGTRILADTPMCTVMAAGDDAHGALALARLRVGQLAQQINLLRNQ